MASQSEVTPASVPTGPGPSVFISYSRKNAYFVDRLVRSLEGIGFDCWIDREGIEGGAKWREKISHSIRECQAFVLVVSHDSMNSSIVAQEMSLAEFHGRPIIPLMYEVCDLTPGIDLQLQGLHWVDFVVEHYDDAIVQLETALLKATHRPNTGFAWTQSRLKAWAPWIGSFYVLSGIYHLSAILLFIGGWHTVFSPEQLRHLESLSGFDRVLWALIASLHLAGGIYLFRFRPPVVGIFVTDWCAYTAYVVHGLLLKAPVEFPSANLVSYGIFTVVVWYVWQLRKANLLEPLSNPRTEQEHRVPGEEMKTSPVDQSIKSEDIPNVLGNSPHR